MNLGMELLLFSKNLLGTTRFTLDTQHLNLALQNCSPLLEMP